jgi:hypothetical protein
MLRAFLLAVDERPPCTSEICAFAHGVICDWQRHCSVGGGARKYVTVTEARGGSTRSGAQHHAMPVSGIRLGQAEERLAVSISLAQ